MLVCFTGTMNRTRTDETERYEEFGIHVKNTVTKATDILVTGYNAGRTKLDKARKYGIKILDEDEFFAWLKIENPEYFL